MPEWFTYELIEDFQTAIVGVLGFTGVVWTLRENARLAREIEKTKLKNAVAGARKIAIEELKFFVHVYENGLKDMNPEPNETLLVPRVKRSITPNVMPEIALLDNDDAQVAIEALLTIDEIDRTVSIIATGGDERFFTVRSDRFAFLEKLYSERVTKLKEAVEKLGS